MTIDPMLESELANTRDPRTRINLLNQFAWEIHLKEQEKGRKWAELAYELSTSGMFAHEPYLPGVADSLRSLAALNNDAGRYDLALSQSLRALQILNDFPEDGQVKHLTLVDVYKTISWTHRCLGDYVVATEFAMKGLQLSRAKGDKGSEAGLLNVLSVIYAESNDLSTALEVGMQVIKLCREEGNFRSESIALNNLAMTYLELGKDHQALETCNESLQLARENGLKAVEITALSTMGEIYLGVKNYDQAEEYLLKALELARKDKANPDELQCLINLGKVYLEQQKNDEAQAIFQNALSLSRVCNDRRVEYQCHQLLADYFERLRDFESAFQHYKQFHAIKETVLNEDTFNRLAGLRVIQQVESAKRDAEIHYLKTIELTREIEERRNAQESLQKLASVDSLTGAFNRRELFVMGEKAREQALKAGQPLSAIMIDIDHFKQVNDSYGHAIGDQVLIFTTKIVRESLRQGEIIARYGGDEFAIILPGSTAAQGRQIAERLANNIASQPIKAGEKDLTITISLGIAELNPARDTSLEILLACADQALYHAKQAGRNQQMVYSDSIA